jgi:hypothetical protein
MNQFLKEVSNIIKKDRSNHQFNQFAFVLPTFNAKKVAIDTFESDSSDLFLTIDEFSHKHSSLQNIENLELLSILFNINKLTHPNESFQVFENWGQIMLSDFNDIDNALEDKSTFFDLLSSIKQIEDIDLENDEAPLRFNLSEEIRKENKSEFFQNFIATWDLYKTSYFELEKYLSQNEKGNLSKRLLNIFQNLSDDSFGKDVFYYFIGFNALTPIETQIIAKLIKGNQATIIWDVDKWYFNNLKNTSGYFIRNAETFFAGKSILVDSNKLTIESKEVVITETTYQNQEIDALLNYIHINKDGIDKKDTIIICNDEDIVPLLKIKIENFKLQGVIQIDIPDKFRDSLIFTFLILIKNLGNSYDVSELGIGKYLSSELAMLMSSPITHALELFNSPFLEDLYLESQELSLDELTILNLSKNDILIKSILSSLTVGGNEAECITELIESIDLRLPDYVGHTKIIREKLATLERLSQNHTIFKGIVYWNQLLNQLSNTKLPLKNIQVDENRILVRGLLETRALDYKTVFMISCNEGYLPLVSSSGSYIPMDLRLKYNLSIPKRQENLSGYYFWRLIQHAQYIHLYYHKNINQSKMESRFVTQLTKILSLDNSRLSISYNSATEGKINLSQQSKIIISKDEEYLIKVKNILKNGLSPSLMFTFITCNLKFYFEKIIGLPAANKLADDNLEGNVLGIIFHKVLENFFSYFLNKTTTKEEILSHWQSNKKQLLKTAIESANFNESQIQLIYNSFEYYSFEIILDNYIKDELSRPYKSLEILALEKPIEYQIRNDDYNLPIFIKGTIDRMQRTDNILEIIDYKTGAKYPLSDNHIKEYPYLWTYKDTKKDNLRIDKVTKDDIQQSIYKHIILNNDSLTDGKFVPDVDAYLYYVRKGGKMDIFEKQEIVYVQGIEKNLLDVVDWMLDVHKNIVQTNDIQNCKYCDYNNICKLKESKDDNEN